MTTRKKKNNIGAFGHPIYGKGFAKYGEMQPNVSSETPKDLEEAAKKYAYKGKPAGLKTVIEPIAEQVMRDFIAGAKWQKEQNEKFENFKEYTDNALISIEEAREQGRQEMKEKMMKEVVEGEISSVDVGDDSYVKTLKMPELQKAIRNYNLGDKVRIIILKEDKQ